MSNKGYKPLKSDNPEVIKKISAKMMKKDEGEVSCGDQNYYLQKFNEVFMMRKSFTSKEEFTETQISEISTFFENVAEEHYIELTTIGDEVTSQLELHKNFINKIYHIIPEFIKERYDNSKEVMLASFRKDDDSNFLVYIIKIFELIKLAATEGSSPQNLHNLLVWGISGTGKTTLIKTIATAFNSINPQSKEITGLNISHHETGTKEVSDPVEFFIGNLRIRAQDVPGTDDISKLRKDSDIIKGIKEKNQTIDSILYTYGVGTDPRSGTRESDLFTLQNLALGFKDFGLDLWSHVIVCLTKLNSYSNEDAVKPVFHEEFDNDEESNRQYALDYEEYLENYERLLTTQISVAKEKFKKNWMSLFDFKDLYPDISNEEKEEIYKKIKWVYCGNVLKNRNYKGTDNDFVGATINPIPNFDPIQGKFNKTLAARYAKSPPFILSKNWVNDLVNRIVECSSAEFRLNTASVNHEFVKNREAKKANSDSKAQAERIDAGFSLGREANQATGRAARDQIHDGGNNGGLPWRKILWGTGAVGGVGVAIASGPVGWYYLGYGVAGAATGEGTHWVGRGIKWAWG